MKKIMGVLLIAMAVGLTGCGGKDTNKKEETVTNVSCKEIMEELLTDVEGINTDSTLFYDDEKYEEFFEYLYDTSPDRAMDGAYAYASASYADEITIILAAEEDDVSVIEGHLEERIGRRINDFTGYEPEEVEKLENTVIDTNGRYVIMVVAENSQEIVDDINEIIEKEEK